MFFFNFIVHVPFNFIMPELSPPMIREDPRRENALPAARRPWVSVATRRLRVKVAAMHPWVKVAGGAAPLLPGALGFRWLPGAFGLRWLPCTLGLRRRGERESEVFPGLPADND